MEITSRNEKAKNYITSKLDLVESLSESDFTDLSNYEVLKTTLNKLIFIKQKGFRGIVATAFAGKHINPNYDPLNDFYSCNPRSIFEQGIFYAFEGRVPCGKSDPLNVAKNAKVLDDEWANGRRPQTASQAAVDYLRFAEIAPEIEKEKVINYFFFKLSEYARSIKSIQITMPKQESLANQDLANKLLNFILKYPESGTTPQLIVSKLLKQVYRGSNIKVEGGDESVFGTNTTSKKPGDIWLEESEDPFNLFEVTVKKVDFKRLDDCIDSLHAVSMLDKQVTFICRVPEDVTTLNLSDNSYIEYKGKVFNFVDIKNFIPSLIALLSAEDLAKMLSEIQDFVEMLERPVVTKNGWNSIFNQ